MKCNALLKRKFISIFDSLNGRLKIKRGPGDYRATNLEHGNDLPQIFKMKELTKLIDGTKSVRRKVNQLNDRLSNEDSKVNSFCCPPGGIIVVDVCSKVYCTGHF